jgi:hypothetical protein
VVAKINRAMEEARETALEEAKAADVPEALRKELRARMRDAPKDSWDKALYDLVSDTED